MVVKVEAWRTPDGKDFHTRREAELHQATLALNTILAQSRIGLDVDVRDSIVAYFTNNATAVTKALEPLTLTDEVGESRS